MVPARLDSVTLGVVDVARMRAFYESLGWHPHPSSDEGFARYDSHGAKLFLYPLRALCDDIGLAESAAFSSGFRGLTLARLVASPGDVDSTMEAASAAGARVVAQAADRDWGGRSGYFADPEGNIWEVAWVEEAHIAPDGMLEWP